MNFLFPFDQKNSISNPKINQLLIEVSSNSETFQLGVDESYSLSIF